MSTNPQYISWLVDTGEKVTTGKGKEVPIWELQHCDDEETLSEWASHYRNHYCLDEDIDRLCQGPEGSLIIGALIEMLDSEDEEDEDIDDLIENLLVLQKSIKYGLPTLKEISLYEIGFSDRHIAMEISEELENEFTSNTAAKEQIRLYNEDVSEIITNYPAYYSEVFWELL
jgi:hypothetical protein